jgi:UDP-N-acetylglucosamine 1-carboxyvinyltransferase
MTRFRVRANGPLEGRVEVAGATKNSGVKQMAAALLAPGVTTLRNMPPVLDLDVMSDLLRAVGATVDRPEPNVVRVDASGSLNPEAPYELVSRMRASFNVLGPLLARCGEARVALPGGDNIGSRKVDMHLRGLEAMGADVEVMHGFVRARCDALQGARVVLECPSVGATENLMCAAVLAKGSTVIENAAREPEVTDLAAFLDRMGAQVTGAGTASIEIENGRHVAQGRDAGREKCCRHLLHTGVLGRARDLDPAFEGIARADAKAGHG